MNTSGLFVTGTSTGVGKTVVTCQIARALRAAGTHVGVYKPACSGAELDDAGNRFWGDVRALSAAVGDVFPEEWICPQRLAAPLAPPSAARLEGKSVDSGLLRTGAAHWNGRVELLLVEGVGGLLCPLTDDETVADFAGDLGFPLLIVASLELGTINHTLLTVEVARARGLPIAGVVMNATSDAVDADVAASSMAEIAARAQVPVLGPNSYQSPERNGDHIESGIDWSMFLRQTFADGHRPDSQA